MYMYTYIIGATQPNGVVIMMESRITFEFLVQFSKQPDSKKFVVVT